MTTPPFDNLDTPTADFFQHAAALLEQRAFARLRQLCRTWLDEQRPSTETAFFYLALSLHGEGDYQAALQAISRAIAIKPDEANWHSLNAALLIALGRPDEAMTATMQALELEPDSPKYLTNVGVTYQQMGMFKEALGYYEKVLGIDPVNEIAMVNKATTLLLDKQYAEAKQYCLAHISNNSPINRLAELYNICSEACLHLLEWDQALALCEAGLLQAPEFTNLIFRQGLALSYLERFEEAQTAIDHAQAIQPDIIEQYFLDTPSHKRIKGLPQKHLDARSVYLEMAYLRQSKGDWHMYHRYASVLDLHLKSSKEFAVSPSLAFQVLTFPVAAELRLHLMRRISSAIESSVATPHSHVWRRQKNRRLRIGYLSPDFRNHPMAILSRPLYELHDREVFKVYAYSIYPEPTNDKYRHLISSKCDVFREVSKLSSVKLAELIRQDSIDILIDIAGYTTYSRPELLAMRPAPLQIAYMGFLSTMGANFIDYSIVDDYVVDDAHRADWHEKLIRLPYSLYLYDNELDNQPTGLSREALGLPEDAVVLCCFNHEPKIEPTMFTLWMDILNNVPDSVLWLLGSSEALQVNLRKQATTRGVAADRIQFAGRVPFDQHLKRYQVADLFLDTQWFNGHTTSLEALWQGLPVVACPGDVSSSRVAASFLNALGLNELIAKDLEHYKEIVLHYATDAEARRALKAKLLVTRASSSLFNTHQKVKQVEQAYILAWERYQEKLEPDHIDVPY